MALMPRCVWDCLLLEARMSPCFVVVPVRTAVHFSRFTLAAIYLVALWIALVADLRGRKIMFFRCAL